MRGQITTGESGERIVAERECWTVDDVGRFLMESVTGDPRGEASALVTAASDGEGHTIWIAVIEFKDGTREFRFRTQRHPRPDLD